MRILLATDTYVPVVSGVVSVVRGLEEALLSLGHEVYVVAPGKATGAPKRPEVISIPSLRNPIRRDHLIPLASVSRIQRHIVSVSPDIVHIHTSGPIGLAALVAARRNATPVIATCHGVPGFVTSYFDRLPIPMVSLMERLLWRYTKWFYGSVHQVIAPSKFIRDQLRNHGVTVPISVIPMWIDVAPPRHMAKSPIRAKWSVPPGAYVYLYFGRLDKDKNLMTLLMAFRELLRTVRDGALAPFLLVIGRGSQGTVLQQCIQNHKIAHVSVRQVFLKEHEVEEVYSLADAFVMPGPYEAQSIVTLQALAHNLRVLLARSGALPEIAERFVDRALLFETKNVSDLARVMGESKNMPNHPTPPNAIMEKCYDKRNILANYSRLYASIYAPRQ